MPVFSTGLLGFDEKSASGTHTPLTNCSMLVAGFLHVFDVTVTVSIE
jgi:hypothetical protein